MPVALQREYDFFCAHRKKFMKTHKYKFVVIKGEEVIGFYDCYEKALEAGLARFGATTPFFIEEVKKEEVIYFFHGIA
jgi:hypothetical protein